MTYRVCKTSVTWSDASRRAVGHYVTSGCGHCRRCFWCLHLMPSQIWYTSNSLFHPTMMSTHLTHCNIPQWWHGFWRVGLLSVMTVVCSSTGNYYFIMSNLICLDTVVTLYKLWYSRVWLFCLLFSFILFAILWCQIWYLSHYDILQIMTQTQIFVGGTLPVDFKL